MGVLGAVEMKTHFRSSSFIAKGSHHINKIRTGLKPQKDSEICRSLFNYSTYLTKRYHSSPSSQKTAALYFGRAHSCFIDGLVTTLQYVPLKSMLTIYLGHGTSVLISSC